MQIWTIANQKGGVGKTTTTVCLAGLAAGTGARVLMVDLDPHGSLTSYFGLDPDRQQRSTFQLFEQFKSGAVPAPTSQITQTSFKGLDLIPAATSLAILERQAIGRDGLGLVLSKALAAVRDRYDLALIDCPPQLGVLLVNALAACDRLLIPVQTEFLALKGLERMLHTLQMIQRSRSAPLPYWIVPTMFDRRTQASVQSLRTLRNQYGEGVWPGRIPVDTKFRDASKAGVPPNVFAPQARGVEAYQSLYGFLQVPGVRRRGAGGA